MIGGVLQLIFLCSFCLETKRTKKFKAENKQKEKPGLAPLKFVNTLP
jgi:hypothetical protein